MVASTIANFLAARAGCACATPPRQAVTANDSAICCKCLFCMVSSSRRAKRAVQSSRFKGSRSDSPDPDCAKPDSKIHDCFMEVHHQITGGSVRPDLVQNFAAKGCT